MTTVSDALTAFRASGTGGRIIGYCYSPGQAEWFTLDPDDAACGPAGPLDLDAVFELHATDGARELRWLQTGDGDGRTAVLSDTPQPLSLPPQRRRLAGDVIGGRDTRTGAWATLFTPRYGQVDVPIGASPGDMVEIESAEYVTEDAHGNVSVTDARWVGLRSARGQT